MLLASSATEPAPKPTPTETFRIALGAGAVAGFTVDAVLFPLDTLKTRMQLASSAVPKSPAALLTGLYAGFGPAVVASAPAAAAFFGVYDYVKRVLEEFASRDKARLAPLCHVVAAAAGDVAGSTVRAPFEVVKQRLQSGLYSGVGAAVRGTLAKEGLGGFYTGYGSLVLRELPFDAIQFPLYEYLKTVAMRRKRGGQLETWETSVCGSIAGAISAALTTPLDVVKTRLMTQNVAAPKYNGIVHGISTIAREEGAKALMAGVIPRVMWISLGGAVFFGAFEAAKKVLTPEIVKRSNVSSSTSVKPKVA
ncbi:putative S-adenosylmethionine carrier 2, chloroplastic [Gracilariopsis chorda]|uniref:Putative S-adenosylmethionine carrier 2, chloroplastic n=1 Tax=Gracilariopsis chorda TaxID=448386 RepID=A0A2V3IGN9_9FLOR|nr:putative S-adenosylmethionine carrier 2, chloroplastic [Gracilariopsis chorda]|eukprot:PXF40310.1 putative S-adenosylmethionine carrier 2, chloroplastic [Gracilariopsis chorda]